MNKTNNENSKRSTKKVSTLLIAFIPLYLVFCSTISFAQSNSSSEAGGQSGTQSSGQSSSESGGQSGTQSGTHAGNESGYPAASSASGGIEGSSASSESGGGFLTTDIEVTPSVDEAQGPHMNDNRKVEKFYANPQRPGYSTDSKPMVVPGPTHPNQ
jgi:hypothetical protein